MANSIVQIVLWLAAWVVVFVRLHAMRWEDAHKNNRIALKVWLMMLFFAIGLTGLMDFAASLDAYTANNLSRLVTYCSFPIAINLGIAAAFDAVGKRADNSLIRRFSFGLFLTIIALLIIYILFLSQIPEFNYYETPRSLYEVGFKFIAHSFETVQCFVLSQMFLAYLPSETSAVMRARVRMILAGSFVLGIYLLIMIAISGGYFWPALASPMLNGFSAILAASSMILHLAAFLHNKIYARLVMLSRSFEHWRAFQDLQYLAQRLTQLFPPAGLALGKPAFWQFLLDPEYHLYRAVILILDGRTMLNDFLAEAGDSSLAVQDWEIKGGFDLLGAAQEVGRALQNVHPSEDFYEIVAAYRRASRDLSES